MADIVRSPLVVPLEEADDPSKVGHKAARLAVLRRQGFPVPWGFVVSTDAFAAHLERVSERFPSATDPEALASAVMREPLARELKEELRRLWRQRIQGRAAVRSSATIEDSVQASFAGQFETILNVSGLEDGERALKSVWASALSPLAREYARHQHGPADDVSMAVLIQEMVDPLVAGVAFTCEPLTGDTAVFYAEWISGSGQELVSGDGISGRAWISRDGFPLRVDHLERYGPLPAEVWPQLGALLRRITAAEGERQDVEWAWTHHGGPVLLQTRPVTGKETPADGRGGPAPWQLPGTPAGGWTERQRALFDLWDEYNPLAVLPLEYDLFMRDIWQASLDMLEREGDPPAIETAVVVLDGVPVAIDPACRVTRFAHQDFRLREAGSGIDLKDAAQQWRVEAKAMRATVQSLATITDNKLVDELERFASFHARAARTRLMQMHRWMEGEAEAKARIAHYIRPRLTNVAETIETLAGGADNETARMNRALWDVTRTWRRTADQRIRRERLDAFVDEFGHFSSDGVLMAERRKELEAYFGELASTPTSDIDAFEMARQRAKQLLSELCDGLSAEARADLRSAVESLRQWNAIREDTKSIQDLPLPIIRRLTREAGERLASRSILPDPGDVGLLSFKELRNCLTDPHHVPTADFARRRDLLTWKRSQSWLPFRFGGKPADPDSAVLIGLPASPGRGQGPARLVRGPDDFARVQWGDVVVARATNPLWTQLFARISGIVVETGSRLSHAAIVAREFEVPAVVGIAGVMGAVKEGETLLVDGTAGEVRRQGAAEI